MLNAILDGICELSSSDKKEYRLLVILQAEDEYATYLLAHYDTLFKELFGENSEYFRKTNNTIMQLDSNEYTKQYLFPLDMNIIMQIIEIFTYGVGTNIYLFKELITKDKLLPFKRRDFYFYILEILNKTILQIKEEEQQKDNIECVKNSV